MYVDNQQIGTTPCAVDFTYYGTREIRLVKPGYETLTVNQPIPTPWYEFPPLDFVSDNLVGMKIRDNRTVTYNLSPQVIVPTPQLVERAAQLRQDALQYPGTPAGAAVPVGPASVVPTAPMIAPGRRQFRLPCRRERIRKDCQVSTLRPLGRHQRLCHCQARRRRCYPLRQLSFSSRKSCAVM